MFLIRDDFKDDGNGVRFVGMRKFVSVSLDSKYVMPSASLPSKLIVKNLTRLLVSVVLRLVRLSTQKLQWQEQHLSHWTLL